MQAPANRGCRPVARADSTPFRAVAFAGLVTAVVIGCGSSGTTYDDSAPVVGAIGPVAPVNDGLVVVWWAVADRETDPVDLDAYWVDDTTSAVTSVQPWVSVLPPGVSSHGLAGLTSAPLPPGRWHVLAWDVRELDRSHEGHIEVTPRDPAGSTGPVAQTPPFVLGKGLPEPVATWPPPAGP